MDLWGIIPHSDHYRYDRPPLWRIPGSTGCWSMNADQDDPGPANSPKSVAKVGFSEAVLYQGKYTKLLWSSTAAAVVLITLYGARHLPAWIRSQIKYLSKKTFAKSVPGTKSSTLADKAAIGAKFVILASLWFGGTSGFTYLKSQMYVTYIFDAKDYWSMEDLRTKDEPFCWLNEWLRNIKGFGCQNRLVASAPKTENLDKAKNKILLEDLNSKNLQVTLHEECVPNNTKVVQLGLIEAGGAAAHWEVRGNASIITFARLLKSPWDSIKAIFALSSSPAILIQTGKLKKRAPTKPAPYVVVEPKPAAVPAEVRHPLHVSKFCYQPLRVVYFFSRFPITVL